MLSVIFGKSYHQLQTHNTVHQPNPVWRLLSAVVCSFVGCWEGTIVEGWRWETVISENRSSHRPCGGEGLIAGREGMGGLCAGGSGNIPSWVPHSKLFLGLPFTFHRGWTAELPQVAFTRLCTYSVCVCVSPSAEVCTESQKATLLLSARNVRPGASIFTSTKVLQKQYNLCLRVNNANQSRLSGYRLPSHLSLVKHTLSLSVLTAPTWNLTLCIHVYMRCVAWLK